jgi:hypothetical protein
VVSSDQSLSLVGKKMQGAMNERRLAIIREAIEKGYPLHRLEEYFDWLDNIGAESITMNSKPITKPGPILASDVFLGQCESNSWAG